ncbi:hypothetical protein [Paractinoplanes durhamensis]|uniref:hypothetical protein n=1 Tax=Paractinoplanes durhamensis TaxID=113563 RepID=UPI0031CFD5EA
MSVDVASDEATPARDYDGSFKSALEINPKDTLRLVCGVEVGDGEALGARVE